MASKLAEFNELLALNLELRKNEQVLSCYIGARDEQLHHLARLSALSLSSGSSQGDAPSGTSSSTRGSDASGAQTSAGSLEQDAAATPQWRAAQAAEPLAAERPRPAGPEARSGASAAAPSPPGCTGPLAAGRQVSLQTASSGGDDMHCEAAAPGASPSVAPAVGAGPAPNVAGPHAAAVAVAVAVAGPAAQTAAAGAPGALPAGACQSQQDVLETYARCVHRVAPLVGAAQAGHPEALALVEAHVREMEEAMAKWMWKNPGTLMQMGGMHLFQPGVRADDSLWSRVACAVPFGGRCGAVTAWRQHLGALAAVMERQKALATKLRAMMAEDQGVQSRGEALMTCFRRRVRNCCEVSPLSHAHLVLCPVRFSPFTTHSPNRPLARPPGAGTRLQSLVDMFAITDALRRTLDEEGELWLLYLIGESLHPCCAHRLPMHARRVGTCCAPSSTRLMAQQHGGQAAGLRLPPAAQPRAWESATWTKPPSTTGRRHHAACAPRVPTSKAVPHLPRRRPAAARKITPSVNRAAAMVNCFPCECPRMRKHVGALLAPRIACGLLRGLQRTAACPLLRPGVSQTRLGASGVASCVSEDAAGYHCGAQPSPLPHAALWLHLYVQLSATRPHGHSCLHLGPTQPQSSPTARPYRGSASRATCSWRRAPATRGRSR